MSSFPDTDKVDDKIKNKKRWYPLESNPTLLNKYISQLGFDTSLYSFVDVYSTESWALELIPGPVLAVIMLYPLSDAQENHRRAEDEERIKTNIASPTTTTTNKNNNNNDTNNVWYIKQRIGNACGTIGILHALANIPPTVAQRTITPPPSWLGTFLQRCPMTLPPLEKAAILEADDAIEMAHDRATRDVAAQTGRGGLDDDVRTHFVAFVRGGDGDGGELLYELDGRKCGPVRHGVTTSEGFLRDVCGVIEGFMRRDPGEVRFSILALVPTLED